MALVVACASQKAEPHKATSLSIMFYNVENLFDTVDNPLTMDEEYLPTGSRHWNGKRYRSKLNRLSEVLQKIDRGSLPDLLGLCEVENRQVVEDLTSSLNSHSYKIEHFESPDHRGIDVALLYNSNKFRLLKASPIYVQLVVPKEELNRLSNTRALELLRKHGDGSTRNLLKVELQKGRDTFCVFVCHFPSRRGGKSQTEYKRIQVASVLRDEVKKVQSGQPGTSIIIMGDFNDEPLDRSIKQVLQACDTGKTDCSLYNLYLSKDKENLGSYRYRDHWNMLDQIIISKKLWNSGVSADIFAPEWLIQTGKYEGYPLRTFGGRKYLDGYSDHFPILAKIPE